MDKVTMFSKLIMTNLNMYVQIHDDMFKFSLRKVIPIPFIFKKIKFDLLTEELRIIKSNIGVIEIELRNALINKEIDILIGSSMQGYLISLSDTVDILGQMTHLLNMKSQNKSHFNYQHYSDLLEEYNACVLNYVQDGDSLNLIISR